MNQYFESNNKNKKRGSGTRESLNEETDFKKLKPGDKIKINKSNSFKRVPNQGVMNSNSHKKDLMANANMTLTDTTNPFNLEKTGSSNKMQSTNETPK